MGTQTHYLYIITRTDGCKYVGVSIDPKYRFKRHILGKGSIHLIGHTDATIEIICQGSKEYIYGLERDYIKQNKPELNISEGGEGGDSGNAARGENHGHSKLLEKDIVTIRERVFNGELYREIAKEYGVSHATIYSACVGKTWRHAGGPISSLKSNRPELIKRVKELFDEGLSGREIAEILPISMTSAYRYRNL